MYDARLRLSNQVADEVNKHFSRWFSKQLYRGMSSFPKHPASVSRQSLRCRFKSTVNYLNLAKELLEKEEERVNRFIDK
jgi:chromosome partitioning protein